MATVSSVDSLSTTMISSAQESDSRAAWMLAASLKVMMVAVTGTATSLARPPGPAGKVILLAGERHLLDGAVVDDRLRVFDQRLQLVVAGDHEIALRLQDEEALGHACLVLLLFRFEAAL